MSRVKRGTTKLKHRKYVLAKTKGMRGNIHSKERKANEVLAHAGNDAFQHRHKKKGDFRTLWNVRINAAIRPFGLSYSKFIGALKTKNIALNRKMLSELAQTDPETFARVAKEAVK
jgi:large subunit ribosomal protein L20